MSSSNSQKTICLFDVDGTITDARQVISIISLTLFLFESVSLFFFQFAEKENQTRNGRIHGAFKAKSHSGFSRWLRFGQNPRATWWRPRPL